MPLSAAEKQRRYRERRNADPQRREEYLKKEREAWQRKKESGKVKSIKEQSPRVQRRIRKEWRAARKRHNEKKSRIMTPPSTPEDQESSTSRLIYIFVKY